MSPHKHTYILTFLISVRYSMYWRRQWQPTPVLLPGKSHGWRSLVGCSPWGRYESDTTDQLHFHFSLSCVGEGNGNPLQCSCLENPRDGGAWWTAVYGVTQSRTQLKRLSSSSIPCMALSYFECSHRYEYFQFYNFKNRCNIHHYKSKYMYKSFSRTISGCKGTMFKNAFLT